MAERQGHFEKGRWVEDEIAEEKPTVTSGESEDPKAGEATETVDNFDEKIEEIKSSVSKNLNDLFVVGKALITTEKGREHLSKKVKKAEEKIDKTIEEIAEGFEKAVKK